ncbi:unnamed protein product, partial [Medioppia subpectinata]
MADIKAILTAIVGPLLIIFLAVLMCIEWINPNLIESTKVEYRLLIALGTGIVYAVVGLLSMTDFDNKRIRLLYHINWIIAVINASIGLSAIVFTVQHMVMKSFIRSLAKDVNNYCKTTDRSGQLYQRLESLNYAIGRACHKTLDQCVDTIDESMCGSKRLSIVGFVSTVEKALREKLRQLLGFCGQFAPEEAMQSAKDKAKDEKTKDKGKDKPKDAKKDSKGGKEAPKTSAASGGADGGDVWPIKTTPYDPRFPNQNQSRNCYQNYLDYHRCLKVKNDDKEYCHWYQWAYTELCPKSW